MTMKTTKIRKRSVKGQMSRLKELRKTVRENIEKGTKTLNELT